MCRRCNHKSVRRWRQLRNRSAPKPQAALSNLSAPGVGQANSLPCPTPPIDSGRALFLLFLPDPFGLSGESRLSCSVFAAALLAGSSLYFFSPLFRGSVRGLLFFPLSHPLYIVYHICAYLSRKIVQGARAFILSWFHVFGPRPRASGERLDVALELAAIPSTTRGLICLVF
jgi:hypothetical protein